MASGASVESRRQFLQASVSAVAAPVVLPAMATPAVVQESRNSATIRAGDLSAVVGDNAAGGEHRAGYNGLWSLMHTRSTRNVFVPQYAGLNLEHLITGDWQDEAEVFFEPRHAAMELTVLSESSAELHQPPTPVTQVESWTRFTVQAPHYLDMEFRCIPRKAVFSRGYLAMFWASYMNAPEDKSMYFSGGLPEQVPLWTQFATQYHNDQSTVRHRDDRFEMTFAEDGRSALFRNLSRLRFDEPMFYGRIDGLMWMLMFDVSEGIRFTHSPSGGGVNDERKTSNPAWDFQYLIRNPQVNQEYRCLVRTVLRPECSRRELQQEFNAWRSQRQ